MSGSGCVIAVTSLALEARIALGPGVSVICQQGAQLSAALAAAVERGVAGIISFGIAGGLASDLVAGDWIVGAAVTTGSEHFPTDQAWARRLLEALPGARHAHIVGADAPVASAADKRQLHARTGAAVVDTESHIAARVAAACRVPFAVCRTVIDAVDMDLPPAAMVGLHHDGTPDLLAVLRSVARQPGQLPALVRTALCARIAEAALRRGRQRLGAALGLPRGNEAASDLQAASLRRAASSAERPHVGFAAIRGSTTV